MPAQYPGAVTTLPGTSPPNLSDTVGDLDHPARHDQVELELNAITAELGTEPKGAAASVAARLNAIDESIGTVENTLSDAEGSDASLPDRLDRMQSEIDAASSKVIVNDYTSAGTHAWTKPEGAVWVRARLVGGGGGGASGQVSGNAGGGGASAGAIIDVMIPASEVAESGDLVVGAGGSGGAASTGAGNAGANGGASTFSGVSAAGGIRGGATSINAAGAAQTNVSSLAYDLISTLAGGNGGAGFTGSSSSAQSRPVPTGGGGGAGRSGALNGGAGGAFATNNVGWPTAVAAGGTAPGGNGQDGATSRGIGLGGGGGASAVGATAGGRGGDGGYPGGGGGGGGASETTSGRGGNGGGGRVTLWWHIA